MANELSSVRTRQRNISGQKPYGEALTFRPRPSFQSQTALIQANPDLSIRGEKRLMLQHLVAHHLVSPSQQQTKKKQATTVLSNCISTLNQTQTHDPQYDLLIC